MYKRQGDDAGGGVIWAPQVIEDAKDHGLVLGKNGKLYDSKKNEALPKNVAPMPLMTDEHLALMAEPAVYEVIPRWVARYLDLLALSTDGPIEVIGQNGQIFDRPGFTVDFVSGQSTGPIAPTPFYTVLIPVKGYWRLNQNEQASHIGPGDTAFLQPNTGYDVTPAMSGEAAFYRIQNTNDPAGPTWWERS